MPTTLDGRYQLEKLIGGGGMGEVWQAADLVLARDVAVKIIRTHLADSKTVRARLRLEAQLAGSLDHPGIVEVFDYGEHDDGTRTLPYLVMPLIDGEPLSRVLNAIGTLTVGQTMAIVADVAEALEASHQTGIVHRDLKPGNILLDRSGRAKLVDFGIARAADGAALTETGALLGTVDYLSPEQCAGQTATPASDVYGLGVVAYACLTGDLPFRRESEIATALAHMREPVPLMNGDLPEPARRLVEHMLAKKPADRPADAAAVAAAARALATELPSIELIDRATTPGPRELATSMLVEPRTVTRRPVRRTALLSVGTAVAAVGAYIAISTQGTDRVEVPSVRGDMVAAATAELEAEGLKVTTRPVDVPNHPSGEVVRQSPAAGTTVDEDTVVTIAVATGRVRIPADDLIGSTYARAATRLKALGLVPRRKEATSSQPAGTVVAVDPSGRAEDGSTVTVSVAIAPVAIGSASSGSSAGSGVTRTPSKAKPKANPKPKPAKGKGNSSGKGANRR